MNISSISIDSNAKMTEISISGIPEQVSQFVTRLFNFGAIAKVPRLGNYAVTINSNRKKIIRACLAMAEASLTKGEISWAKARGNKPLAKKAIRNKIIARALNMARMFN